jgi:hypothetical protein
MRNIRNNSHIRTILRHTGISFKNSPSIDFPIPVPVFYRNKPDGTVNWFWPKGNRQTAFSKLYHRSTWMKKWATYIYSFCFSFGLENFLADGTLVLYTDLPTATYLKLQWNPG